MALETWKANRRKSAQMDAGWLIQAVWLPLPGYTHPSLPLLRVNKIVHHCKNCTKSNGIKLVCECAQGDESATEKGLLIFINRKQVTKLVLSECNVDIGDIVWISLSLSVFVCVFSLFDFGFVLWYQKWHGFCGYIPRILCLLLSNMDLNRRRSHL